MFNSQSRINNVIKIAAITEVCTVINQLMGFVYRTIFLIYLSNVYLGINGLFVNVLQLLSLADLGIGTAITFRFYKPIKEGNINKVGALMIYFKTVYRIILLVIISLGIVMIPFLNFFIKDISEIPSDVNISIVYLLFLTQTAASYMFAYKHTLLTVDQRQHTLSVVQSILSFFKYIMQIVVLVVSRNFTITLIISIGISIIGNYIISIYVTKLYKEVFSSVEKLTKYEKREILIDTRACMFHKIGGRVLTSTDSIILSKFVGIISVGIYANYSLIITSINNLASQIFSNTTASLGNMAVSLDASKRYAIYKKMLFVNLWVASSLAACICVLINPFIRLWVGDDSLLSTFTVSCLTAQFYLGLTRQINIAFTSANGLFVKDMYRPVIEAGLNLVMSIILVKYLDIAGVFLGTVISSLLTVTWREPYLLFKYDFKCSTREYWLMYSSFTSLTIFVCILFNKFIVFPISSFISWMGAGVLTFGLTQVIMMLLFKKKIEFAYLKNIVIQFSKKLLKKNNKAYSVLRSLKIKGVGPKKYMIRGKTLWKDSTK